MLIRIKSDSLLKIYTADSVSMVIEAKYDSLSANSKEFMHTAVRLLEFLHKNEISSDDIFGEIAGTEESAILCVRELSKAGLFYTEKYKPQYVCFIRDDFLKDVKKDTGLVYNTFARMTRVFLTLLSLFTSLPAADQSLFSLFGLASLTGFINRVGG